MYEIVCVFQCPGCGFVTSVLASFPSGAMDGKQGFESPRHSEGHHEPKVMALMNTHVFKSIAVNTAG